uniref:Uncharacterized protein n=1 Tax=Arundo donax TaxID=35708 RepID=A0A0A9GRL1_ARUDO
MVHLPKYLGFSTSCATSLGFL